jgi:hypothetical protein
MATGAQQMSMTHEDEASRRQGDIQLARDIGRLEGKVDSLLRNMQELAQNLGRSDAERDNLARDLANLERQQVAALNAMGAQHMAGLAAVRTKLYWLSGLTAGGGMGLGATAGKLISVVFGH